jgi:hypothetical protein
VARKSLAHPQTADPLVIGTTAERYRSAGAARNVITVGGRGAGRGAPLKLPVPERVQALSEVDRRLESVFGSSP